MISPETSAFTYTTYSSFCTKVRRIGFPASIGEKQRFAFDSYLVNAMIKAQRYIQCLRRIQVSFYSQDQMSVQCGVATLVAPRGKLNVVYAFKPGEQCLKHFYRPVTPHHITCWSQDNSCKWSDPPGVGTEVWSGGEEVCDLYEALYSATEDDTCYKCEPKFYSRGQNGELYLAPRPPCGYIVAVHWEGLRRTWSSSDAIPDDADLIDWVAEQVQSEMTLRLDKDPTLAGAMRGNANNKFADLMYWCNEERRIQMELDCANGIDTGNLNDMFNPIYPYPYQEI